MKNKILFSTSIKILNAQISNFGNEGVTNICDVHFRRINFDFNELV